MATPGTWGVLNFGPSALTVQAGSSVPITATVNISSAQLLALSTTPITIVAAPGAGFYISPVSYVLEYTYGGIAYSSPLHTNNCFLNYGGQTINSTNFAMSFDWALLNGFIESTVSCIAIGPCANAPIALSVATNNSLIFGAPNALTLGNGTLKVIVTYVILPV